MIARLLFLYACLEENTSSELNTIRKNVFKPIARELCLLNKCNFIRQKKKFFETCEK